MLNEKRVQVVDAATLHWHSASATIVLQVAQGCRVWCQLEAGDYIRGDGRSVFTGWLLAKEGNQVLHLI